eukprot:Skav208339  [mRNA]  locus=scaffold5193:38831:45910:+ [translate_table: standard]
MVDGKWAGASQPWKPDGHSADGAAEHGQRPSEKITVPEFDGEEGEDGDVGRSARSYVRKIQAWVRATRLPPPQRALALYTSLKGKAWVYAEELDLDRLGTAGGMSYYLDWIQTRFMDVEVSKISQMMSELFYKCKRKPDQSVRDFNVEYERMVLRLHEVKCDLPPTVKAWLYLNKLRLSEAEELALLSSVNNEYDVRRLQQAALIQDKATRKSSSARPAGGKGAGRQGRWARSVHMTTGEPFSEEDTEDEPEDENLWDEETATVYLAYQGAKAKYRDALRGRGTDPQAVQKASEERLRLAKQRSYCSVCKRRGHWHKDAECPANQQKKEAEKSAGASQHAQMCYHVYMAMGEAWDKADLGEASPMLAIVDTACTRSVAGYHWFETYYNLADNLGIRVNTVDIQDTFKFGASRIFSSDFAVQAWFAVQGRWFVVRVAIVRCDVPLLLSREVLAGLGMTMDVAAHRVDLKALDLANVQLSTSCTGHPALDVSQYPHGDPPFLAMKAAEEIWVPRVERVYMVQPSAGSFRPLFYPKKIPLVVQNFLETDGTVMGNTFFTWWKRANQSRDFWLETPMEMIRIHVCPRKEAFDPSKWNTSLHELKDSLMGMLAGPRITEAIPCLSEGTQVECRTDDFREPVSYGTWHGPWIGRSRFPKQQQSAIRNPLSAPFDVRLAVTMEDEQGSSSQRAAGHGCAVTPLVDRAGAETTPHRQAQGGLWRADRGGDRALQDDTGAADRGVQQVPDHSSHQADPGATDAPTERCQEVAGRLSDACRPLSRLDLPRDPQEVHGVGRAGGGSQQGHKPRFEEVRNLGPGGVGGHERKASVSFDRIGEGSGGEGQDCTTDHGRIGVGQQLGTGVISGIGGRVFEEAAATEVPSGGGDGGGSCGHHECQGRDHRPREAIGGLEAEGEVGFASQSVMVTENVEKYVTFEHEGLDSDDDEVNYVVNDLQGSMSDGSETSPRQKARAGVAKRKWEKMSGYKKAKVITGKQLNRLMEVFMVVSAALGSWTQEVLCDPMNDLYTAFQATHRHPTTWNSQQLGSGDVDCLEIFSGHSKISTAFANKRRGVLQPRDILLGHDMRDGAQRDEVFRDLYQYRPKMVWLAPPCTHWCAYSRMNFSPQERRRRRSKDKVFIELIEEVIVFQRGHGGLVVVENPRTSDLWKHSSLFRWTRDPTMFNAQVDLCTYGMISREGVPMKKGLTLLTNGQSFAKAISRRCDHSHEHQRIEGAETSRSAIYPDKFAKEVVYAYDEWRRCRPGGVWSDDGVHQNFPTNNGGDGKGPDLLQGSEAISFKGKVNPTVASLLKRVHQNFGHPPNRELIRHLKIGGADASVIRAAEQMSCKTCEKSGRPQLQKVAHPVVALDFNEVLAADIVWYDTAESYNNAGLNVVDLASTYQLIIPLRSTKAEDVGEALCSGWFRWAGIPKGMLVDLDSAFKGEFLAMMDRRGVAVRSAAAGAHWQNGVAERHGETWKLIWAKLVEEHLVLDSELEEAICAVNDAKNSLRNRGGFSPRQWVFGCSQRLPGDIYDGDADISVLDASSANSKFARAQGLRNAAKAAFFNVQSKEALQRAMNHRSRVQKEDYEVGDMAYMYRETKHGKSKKPTASWMGPATVIGKEGSNVWLARGGRCYLSAPEHLRPADSVEVGEALRIKMAMKEVKRLIEHEASENEEEVDGSYVDDGGDVEMDAVGISEPIRSPAAEDVASRAAAIRQAAKRNQLLDDVPGSIKRARQAGHPPEQVQHVQMAKRCISQKGKEKQLEKELPWGLIPPDERPLYREAEGKQWAEHVEYAAVRPLSLEESAEVEATIPKDRILNSRFAYRDKNYAKRKSDPSLGPKPKARLCIAGQWDPDLGVKDLATDAPTVCRQSVIIALQLALSRRWLASVGDIRAAFLNGIPAPRKLYFRQPRGGIEALHPGQLVEVLKGVFGLSTSPKLWWTKLSSDLRALRFQLSDGRVLRIEQNPIDPCVFMLIDDLAKPYKVRGLLLTHVDDIMLLTEAEIQPVVEEQLKAHFPIDEWDKDDFEYVGCEFECRKDYIRITQLTYAKNRVDKVTIHPGQHDDEPATREQVEENRTSIGSMSWLAKQTRPDLQFAVSQAQRKQAAPTVKDLKATNKAVDMAAKHSDCGIKLRYIPEEELAVLAFHDASWGNVDLGGVSDDGDAPDWTGGHQVASQMGIFVVAVDRKALQNQDGAMSVLHWQSKGCRRVCSLTFAGETMACSEAVENGLYLRGLLVSMKVGYLVPEKEGGYYVDFHCVTDCKSLYDHTHREGTPKAPADKRLTVDLAALRQVLFHEGRVQWEKQYNQPRTALATPERPCRPPLHWLPTGEQLADVLTKLMKADAWWDRVNLGLLRLPLRTCQANGS